MSSRLGDHGVFFNVEVGANVGEARQRATALDERGHVGELLVEAMQDLEDKGVVKNGLAQVTQRIGHALHLTAILGDVKISLDKSMELDIEDNGTSLLVADKLLLET